MISIVGQCIVITMVMISLLMQYKGIALLSCAMQCKRITEVMHWSEIAYDKHNNNT